MHVELEIMAGHGVEAHLLIGMEGWEALKKRGVPTLLAPWLETRLLDAFRGVFGLETAISMPSSLAFKQPRLRRYLRWSGSRSVAPCCRRCAFCCGPSAL